MCMWYPKCRCYVTPLAGVWIEIISLFFRGKNGWVTPLAGVWIEILINIDGASTTLVTPLAGVWIEINSRYVWLYLAFGSLPSRECGLKYHYLSS